METKNMLKSLPLVAVAFIIILNFLDYIPTLQQGWVDAITDLSVFVLILSTCFWVYKNFPKFGALLMLPVFLLGLWLHKEVSGYIFSKNNNPENPLETEIIKKITVNDRYLEFDFLNKSGHKGRMYAVLQPCERQVPVYSNRIDLGQVRSSGWTHLYFSFKDISWEYLDVSNCLEIPLYFVPEEGSAIMVGAIPYKKDTSL